MTSYISVILKSTTLQKIFPNLNSIIRNKIFLSSVTFNTDINEPQNSSELSNNVLANNNNNEGEQFRYLLRNSAFINVSILLLDITYRFYQFMNFFVFSVGRSQR